jgi:hypothetical protein
MNARVPNEAGRAAAAVSTDAAALPASGVGVDFGAAAVVTR